MVWRDQLILHRAGVIESYQASTGERTWFLPESTSGTSTPEVAGDIVYVNTWNNLGEDDQRPVLPDFAGLLKQYDKDGDGAISASEFPDKMKFTSRPELDEVPNSQNYAAFKNIDRNKDGLIQESEWEAFRGHVASTTQDHGLLAIKLQTGSPVVVWRENTSIPEVLPRSYTRTALYLIRNGGVLSCLDAATGKVIYRTRSGSPGPYFASPVAADGRVYLASGEGAVTVLSASKDQLEVLAKNDLGEDIVATPAIAGNTIYIRTLKNLYSYAR